jgi:hypothetical protein
MKNHSVLAFLILGALLLATRFGGSPAAVSQNASLDGQALVIALTGAGAVSPWALYLAP